MSAFTERRDMGLYDVPLSMSFGGGGGGDYVSQLPYLWYYVLLTTSFHMLVRNASPRGSAVVCQDHVSCYFYFGLLLSGPELW